MQLEHKLVILTFAWHYTPGQKAGGALRSIVNLVETLGDEFEFRIITSDRDLRDTEPYPGLVRDQWLPVGKAWVMYLSPRGQSLGNLVRLLRHVKYDVIYLNSFFARRWSIVPLLLHRLGLARKVPVVLAPRGEFSAGALNIKPARKRIFLAVARLLGLYRRIIWQASTAYEEADIRRQVADSGATIFTASDLPCPVAHDQIARTERVKESGSLRAVFLSRISRMKNLDAALRMLNGLSGQVLLDIYGPAEDNDYWAECQATIAQLPENVRVNYRGHLPHDRVTNTLADYDLFVLPTLGENFGHVISEALTSGCPVLLSDQTPWRGLEEAGVGWDIPLDETDRSNAALQKCVDMGHEEHLAMRGRAREFVFRHNSNPEFVEQNRMLFLQATGLSILAADKAGTPSG